MYVQKGSVQSWLENRIDHPDLKEVGFHNINIRLGDVPYTQLRKLAKRAGVTFTAVVVTMLESSLAELSQNERIAKILNDE